jgi:release factor glutamine methyltransferase
MKPESGDRGPGTGDWGTAAVEGREVRSTTTVVAAVSEAVTQLRAVSDSARLDAELLLAHVMGTDRGGVIVAAHDVLDEGATREYENLVARRARGEPVAYLTGDKHFWGQCLQVGPAVLVPRPDTEVLVAWALELARALPAPAIADLGTGSGCIALALALELPQASVTATDVSRPALAVAGANAERHHAGNLAFLHGDWFAPLAGRRFDLLVSNPPYVASGDPHLADLRFEPAGALEAGADGLDAIRILTAGAPAHLRRAGWLLLEHGADQAGAVRALLQQAGFTHIETRRDLAGHERASGGRWMEAQG